MEKDGFFEIKEAIHEVVEDARSKICYSLILDLMSNEIATGGKNRILDIGCGDGSFITKFRKHCETFGVDISQNAIIRAKEAGINAYEVDVSSQKLPFRDRYFDIIYMGDVIEHLINPDYAIKEVIRALRLNGFLVLSTPNLASWVNRLLLLIGMQPLFAEVSTVGTFGRGARSSRFCPVGHLRLFTYKALREFLTYYQFNITKVSGAPYENLPKVLGNMDRILSRIPSLSSIIILACQKQNEVTT
jgi:2-polyprenyl-3-methyl-5-hydroxy-6-metoxy-1,4-benzoquinol methylase